MEIDINQKKISLGDEYRIYINGSECYFADSRLISLLPKIYLFHCQEDKAKVSIEKRWGWFSAKYDIKYSNHLLNFRTRSFWKLHYECQFGNDLFDIYGHRGRKYSVYKNDHQIAKWDKEMVAWFEGDNYHIVVDEQSEYELVIAFCLIIDNYSNNSNDGNTMTVDLGNIGFQKREFNSLWSPKTV
ncbi:MAG: hypothetical protein WA958_12765 [Tunicatimonas sp.]